VKQLYVTLLLLSRIGRLEAYEQRVHVYLSERGYHGPARFTEAGAKSLDVHEELREYLYRAGAKSEDPALRARFLARYPDLHSFDSWTLKRLLGLNPDRLIEGIDQFKVGEVARSPRALYALASRLPDDDQRNRDRFRHDRERHVMRDPYGRLLPEDPATLEMGALTGLSSQAHAHYGLPKIAFSSDPSVLQRDPRRFAVPPTVHTFGAEFVELYTCLAVIASGLESGDRLALLFAGNAAHHLEDLANQIHTVQVGLYDFFVDAKFQSVKEELLSVGGLLRSRPSFLAIGIDVITNHHILAEALYAKHLLASPDPVREASEHTLPDGQFEKWLTQRPADCRPGFGLDVADELIEVSSFEGSAVYRTVHDAAQRRFSKVGTRFSEADDPDEALRPLADLSAFYSLEAQGAKRSDQALAAWWRHLDHCRQSDRQAFAESLLRRQLVALDEIEMRQSKMEILPPAKEVISWGVPTGYLFFLCAAVGLVVRHSRARQRRTRTSG
jgi:hypothetical protein